MTNENRKRFAGAFAKSVAQTATGFAALILALGAARAQQVDPLVPETPDPVELSAPVENSSEAPVSADGRAVLTKADVEAWLDGFMPYALERGGIAGAVVAVVKDGEILASKGYGYADLETKKPVDPAATLFRPGSVSKLFTWTAIMQLVEQGKVDLDADVNKYLDFEIPEAFGAPIKVRHLLTHTAGFEEAIKGIIIEDPDAMLPLDEYVKKALPTRVYPAGEVPAYSNYATTLAGYIVARVSGQSFDDYIEQHVFAPIGMTRSSFRQPLPAELEPLISKGYKSTVDGKAQFYEIVTPAPAGSLAATGNDMARFMIAHLDKGGPLLKPETAELMHTTYDPHTPPLNAMALGFYQQNEAGLRAVGHGGDTIFFHSDMHLFLDKGVGLFVSVNSAGSDSGLGTLLLRGQLASNFAERYFSETALEAEEALATAQEHGEKVAGVYEVSRSAITNFLAMTRFLGQMKVTVSEDGELLVPFAGGVTHWREVEPFVWRKKDSWERLSATFDESGRVDQLSFEPFSPFMTYSPAPWYRSSALLSPLLGLALGALVLTAFFWPVRAIVRWRYKTAFALTGKEALGYRFSRIAAVAVLAYLGGWAAIFAALQADLSTLTPAFDGNVRIMQIAQIALYIAFAAALWNAMLVWTGARSWLAKVWSLIIPAAIAIVIWTAAIGGLLSFSLTY